MNRVIGLGGPFIKVNDPKAMAAWYEKHLGIPFNGTTYTDWQFNTANGSKRPGYNVLSFFKKETEYFEPGKGKLMINFIVRDLFGLIAKLKEEGVEIVGEPIDEEYGKFGWILDPEGHKVELWEPPAEVVI
jgi:predicted enzyme related to lactoylglutathione lyase